MAEKTSIESRFDVFARLDENFLFLLNFADEGIVKLKQNQQELAQKWLLKLSSMTAKAADAKLSRNVYLNEMILQMQEGLLLAPFTSLPPQGDLPKKNFESDRASDQIENQEWIDKLMKDKQQEVYVGGKNFETYLSTKMFEGGRGACAYLAVSCQNEGDNSAWTQLRSNQKRDKKLDDLFKEEVKKFVPGENFE